MTTSTPAIRVRPDKVPGLLDPGTYRRNLHLAQPRHRPAGLEHRARRDQLPDLHVDPARPSPAPRRVSPAADPWEES
jgi:hypothetical protein